MILYSEILFFSAAAIFTYKNKTMRMMNMHGLCGSVCYHGCKSAHKNSLKYYIKDTP